MSEEIRVRLEQRQRFQFAIDFGEGKPQIVGDEDAPLGEGIGPTPGQLLLAAVANCMSDSLFFALSKFNNDASPIHTEAHATIGRNQEGRLRVLAIHLTLNLAKAQEDIQHLERILNQFEDFCTVGKSVAQGIPVHLTVKDIEGRILKGAV